MEETGSRKKKDLVVYTDSESCDDRSWRSPDDELMPKSSKAIVRAENVDVKVQTLALTLKLNVAA